MARRAIAGALAVLAFIVGIAYAVRSASAEGAGLLFDSATWLVWLAPFAGVLAAGLTRRRDPVIEGDRVLRHDGAAIVEHWTHGVGTAALLASGIALGFLFVPTLLGSGAPVRAAMNIHFVAVLVFLFGTFYYGANTLLATHRFREHLPTRDAVDFTRRHYGLLLGFKKLAFPPERKYFESEKMAYLLALVSTAVIIVTGFLKVAAHAVDVPGWLMAVATPAHDIATIAMLAFFLAHVFFAAILPMSWPVLRSMFTGYVPLEYARHEHAGWLASLGDEPSVAVVAAGGHQASHDTPAHPGPTRAKGND
ncbi:cytochrome b/b6 domain-containing protein [Anaerosoma tenue]|uniref:cytochrome b/b6 domain-containing protein n=1 Tax=Anaerosoma tenue TaxID=2933588 RepID=UPI002260960D|nr:cytochrome b/b6 domain-containing protein [Anaerosoma tenue]MCK8114824.1 cytochrome b/b6 domain-containing protein [Anaerosoma tenue]